MIPASCAVRLSCECVTQYTTLVPSHADTFSGCGVRGSGLGAVEKRLGIGGQGWGLGVRG
jgi:hypothetical protein